MLEAFFAGFSPLRLALVDMMALLQTSHNFRTNGWQVKRMAIVSRLPVRIGGVSERAGTTQVVALFLCFEMSDLSAVLRG